MSTRSQEAIAEVVRAVLAMPHDPDAAQRRQAEAARRVVAEIEQDARFEREGREAATRRQPPSDPGRAVSGPQRTPTMRDDSAAPDAGRVERWARGIAAAFCGDDDRWREFDTEALAAIALADAEAAERVAEGWKAYEEDRDRFDAMAQDYGVEVDNGSYLGEALAKVKWDEARANLDAAVRRLARLESAAGTAGRDGDGGDRG